MRTHILFQNSINSTTLLSHIFQILLIKWFGVKESVSLGLTSHTSSIWRRESMSKLPRKVISIKSSLSLQNIQDGHCRLRFCDFRMWLYLRKTHITYIMLHAHSGAPGCSRTCHLLRTMCLIDLFVHWLLLQRVWHLRWWQPTFDLWPPFKLGAC